MRINNSVNSSVWQNGIDRQQTAAQAAKVDSYVQTGNTVSGPTAAGQRRQAEDLGASLLASQLRGIGGVDSLSLSDILQKLLEILFGKKPNPTPTPNKGTNLQVVGDASFRQRVAQDLATFAPGTAVDDQGYVHAATQMVAGHDQGYQLINNLLNGKKPVTINFTSQNAFTQSGTGATGSPSNPGPGANADVSYDPAWSSTIALPTLQPDGTSKDQPVSSAVVLAHELIHATHAQRGTIDRTLVDHVFTVGGQQFKENWRFEELRTTGFPGQRQGNEPSENSIRAELGFQPRTAYLFSNSWTAVNGIANTTETSKTVNRQPVSDTWANLSTSGNYKSDDWATLKSL